MSKMAIYVEGFTEQCFVEKVIRVMAKANQVMIETRRAYGGNCCKRIYQLLAKDQQTKQEHFIMIIDSSGDNRVASDIKENYRNLIQKGYSYIIGIRDVYPDIKREDITKLRIGIKKYIPTKPLNVLFILGIMEIESWFLAENSHFEKLDSRLTRSLIESQLGFYPAPENVESLCHPSEDLDNIYKLVGLRYKKKEKSIQRTTDNLDYYKLYLEVAPCIHDFEQLTNAIDALFSN